MNRRRAAWLTWLVGLLLGAWLVSRTTFTADMSAFLPRNPSAAQALLVDQLRDGLVSRLILVGLEGGDAAARAAVSREMAGTLRQDAAFMAIQNGDDSTLARDRELLFAHRYLLSARVTPALFSVDGLHRAIAERIEGLSSSAGLMLKQLLPHDPTGETLGVMQQLASQRQPASRDGVWASHDGQRALLLAYTRARGSDTDGQAEAIAHLQHAYTAAHDRLGPTAAGVQLRLAGPGVFALHARDTIRNEVSRLSLISALIIVSLLLAIYRSLRTLLLGLVPMLSGAVVAIVVVGQGFGMVHGITLGFGITLIGEAVDYAIYLFVQGGHAARGSRFWATIRLGVLTSLCGFAALLPSGFPGLSQLGLFSMTGILTAALVTRYLLPHMLPQDFHLHDVTPLGRRLQRASSALAGRGWLVTLLAVAALGVLTLQQASLWDHRLGALSPVSASDQALDQQLRGDLGAPDISIFVVVQGQSADAALTAAEQLAPELDALRTRGLIGSYDSPAHYLPSLAVQSARRAALPDTPTLRRTLNAALAGLPLRPEKLQGFIDDVAQARQGPLLQAQDFDGSAQALAIAGMLSPASQGGWNAILPLHAPAGAELSLSAIEEALAGHPEAIVLDLGHESQHLYTEYLGEARQLCMAGLLAILLLLTLSLRSALRVGRVMLPLLAAVLVVAAALHLGGVRFTLLHLVGMLLIVAVGSNYALFFDAEDRRASPQPSTLASLLFANLTTVAGFGLLAFSSVPVLSAIGMTVGPGAILALLFSALLASPHADRT